MIKINYAEYFQIVMPILMSKEFQKRKKFPHHGKITVYDHTLRVSKMSYVIAKILNVDYESAAIGGLLHDFYTKPWQDNHEHKPIYKAHGFTHGREAAENAYKYYPEIMSYKIENIIKRHMFPLTICPPEYLEGWIVTIADKIVSIEIFKNPKKLYRYIGIRGGKDE